MSKKSDHRRQKKLARKKAKRKPRLEAFKSNLQEQGRLKMSKLKKALSLLTSQADTPLLDDEEYLFWLCHGANYLASDSQVGHWDPLFEDIYQGRMPAPETLAQKVMEVFHEDIMEDTDKSPIAKAVLAWTMTEVHIVSAYKQEAIRRILEKYPDCDAEATARQPGNPILWSLMDMAKAKSIANITKDTPDDPT